MEAEPVFLDTNVLIYASRPAAPHDRAVCASFAAMPGHGIARLLTFNQRDFQRFAGLIALAPI